MSGSHIDLHVHSTASDGGLSPTEVVAEAKKNNVTLLALADHDTTDGVAESQAAARGTSVQIIPAVELSVGSGPREIHVLGYFLDIENQPLQKALNRLRSARDTRNERIIERLSELGAPIDLARVRAIAGDGSVGRPHIATALVEAGHVGSIGEAFRRYLARGKPGYAGRERLSPAEAADLIRSAGGIPVLAHPAKLGGRMAIESLLDEGMEGVEAYHSDHTERDVALLLQIAEERGLLVTGGTDSHGPNSDCPIAVGSIDIPDWVGAQVLSHAPESWTANE